MERAKPRWGFPTTSGPFEGGSKECVVVYYGDT